LGDLAFFDADDGWRDLFVIANYQHLPAAENDGESSDIGLRRLIHHDEVKNAEFGRELLGNPPFRKNPTRNTPRCILRRFPDYATLPGRSLAGAPT
jgi:hypothetical protein